MADKQIHSYDATMLDREDHESLGASTTRQWELLGHLLHLPPIHTLANENQQVVASRIARFVSDVRGGVVDRALLRNELQEAYVNRFNAIQRVDADADPIRAATTSPNTVVAEAWLQTIYENFGEGELRNMIRDLPASILPTTGSRRWEGEANLGGADIPIIIDLSHPAWRTGDQRAIVRRLTDRTPAQVGITTTYADPLSEPEAQSIFASRCRVVDPLLPVGQVQIENRPVRGESVVIDLAPMIRRNPRFARLNAAQMTAELRAHYPIFERYSRHINMRTGAELPAIPVGGIGPIVDALFDQQSRNRADPFGAREVTLTTAIQNRQPIERLITGTASNRELLLALSMIQRDPAAAAVLEQQQAATEEIRTRMTTNENLLHTASAIRDLSAAQLPPLNHTDLTVMIHNTTNVITNIAGGAAAAHGVVVDFATNADEQAAARRARIPLTLRRVNTPPVTHTVTGVTVTPERDNWEQFQRLIDQGQQTLISYEDAEHRIETIQRMLETMIASLQERGITPAQIAGADYAYLRQVICQAAYGVVIDEIGPNLNVAELSRQFIRALREANPANRVGLRDITFYEQEQGRLSTQLNEAMTHTLDEGAPVGSEACRRVVERGLSHEGLRDNELKDTVDYMFNAVQRNRESVQDLRMYADRDIPDGDDDHHAIEHWEHGKTYRPLRRIFRITHPHEEYIHNLANAANLGFDLNGGAEQFQNVRLSRLVDTYFRVDHLSKLPESDPYRLPRSEAIVTFLRNLYIAIGDRAQKSFNRATGMTNAELDEWRATGLGVKVEDLPTMSIQERLALVRSFLQNTNDYMSDGTNKNNLDRMVHRAYHNIQVGIETNNRTARRLSWPFRGIISAGAGLGRFLLSTTRATGRMVNNNRGSMAGGAALAALATGPIAPLLLVTIPAGAIAGLAVKKFFGGSNTSSGTSAHHP